MEDIISKAKCNSKVVTGKYTSNRVYSTTSQLLKFKYFSNRYFSCLYITT